MGKTKEHPKSSEVDCSEGSKRGVWLVKVPKYLSENWKSLAGQGEVGRLYVDGASGSGTPDVIFRTTRKIVGPIINPKGAGIGPRPVDPVQGLIPSSSKSSGNVKSQGGYDPLASCAAPVMIGAAAKAKADGIPNEHKFVIHGDTSNLSLAIYSENKSELREDEKVSGRLSLEGRVVKRAECRPPTSINYMRMKMDKIVDYSKPTRQIKTMDRAVIKFKPVAMHQEMVAREKQKKEGKNVRMDKDLVLERLFQAFEKHQYYKLVDLATITNQPHSYIKELLNEIGRYNTAPPHKFMWELKPEYRHYKTDDQEMEEETSD